MQVLSSTFIAAAVVLAACGTHEQILAVPTTSAHVLPSASSIRALSTQRCTHESACGHVGPGQQFATIDSCLDATALEERTSIGLDDCPFGVRDGQLERCSHAVAARSCGYSLGPIGNLPACNRMVLCR